MNKTWLAAAVLGGIVVDAGAQTNITFYGIIDAGIVAERGGVAGNVTKVTSGVGSVSRLGVRGVEDLGGGLQTLFVLESGFKVDTGESDVANAIANRQAFVGLNSRRYGMLTLGRQKNPLYKALGEVGDPFALAYAGTSKNLFPLVGPNTRTSNTVAYSTPTYQGWTGELTYSMGEQPGSQDAGRQYAAALAYSNGNLNTRLVYNSRNSDNLAPSAPKASHDVGRNLLFVANYKFQVLRALLSYGRDKGYNSAVLPSENAYGTMAKASTDSTDLLVGATVPVGERGTFITSYIHKDDKQWNQDASQFGVAYSYAWSKHTNTYLAYARIRNQNGAGYTVGSNGDAGSGNAAFNLGIRHAF